MMGKFWQDTEKGADAWDAEKRNAIADLIPIKDARRFIAPDLAERLRRAVRIDDGGDRVFAAADDFDAKVLSKAGLCAVNDRCLTAYGMELRQELLS